MTRTIPERVASIVTSVCSAIVVIAVAILPFLTPAWVSFEQGRAQAAAWTGYDATELAAATNSILHDLVLGPPDFAVQIAGAPVLEERERSHMRDVRTVFAGFYAIAVAAGAALVLLIVGARRAGHPERAWAAIRDGMRGLAVGVVIAGVIATFFFDAAFEIFHRIFFPSGSYTFDPRTDRLVQLFPFDFWSETTLVLGAAILGVAAVLWFVTRRLAMASPADGRRARTDGAPLAVTTEARR